MGVQGDHSDDGGRRRRWQVGDVDYHRRQGWRRLKSEDEEEEEEEEEEDREENGRTE